MRLIVSITRKPSPEPPLLREVIAAGLSWKDDDKIVHYLARKDDYKTETDMWLAIVMAVNKSDVTPYGWNIRNDIWPCICLNTVKHGVSSSRLQPLTEKWQKTMLGELSTIANQGFYGETPSAREVYKFLFGEDVEALDEEQRFLSVGPKELEENSYKEHVAYHRMLEAYR